MTLFEVMQRAAERPPALAELSEHLVFGEGDPDADLLIIGEAPGEDEDASGLPFVGRAGQLLDKILASVDIVRQDIYITNMVKFRPPDNRNPSREELAASVPILLEQIRHIRPQIIVTLGNVPTQWFLETNEGITKTRGRWANWQGIALLPMYHPAYLLRNPSRENGSPKWLTWQDALVLKAAVVALPPKPRGNFVIDTAAATPLFEP